MARVRSSPGQLVATLVLIKVYRSAVESKRTRLLAVPESVAWCVAHVQVDE